MNKGYVVDKSPNATEEQIAEWNQMVDKLKSKHTTIVNQYGENNFYISHIDNLTIDLHTEVNE